MRSRRDGSAVRLWVVCGQCHAGSHASVLQIFDPPTLEVASRWLSKVTLQESIDKSTNRGGGGEAERACASAGGTIE